MSGDRAAALQPGDGARLKRKKKKNGQRRGLEAGQWLEGQALGQDCGESWDVRTWLLPLGRRGWSCCKGDWPWRRLLQLPAGWKIRVTRC